MSYVIITKWQVTDPASPGWMHFRGIQAAVSRIVDIPAPYYDYTTFYNFMLTMDIMRKKAFGDSGYLNYQMTLAEAGVRYSILVFESAAKYNTFKATGPNDWAAVDDATTAMKNLLKVTETTYPGFDKDMTDVVYETVTNADVEGWLQSA